MPDSTASIEIQMLAGLAHVRRVLKQADADREELILRYGGSTYSAIIAHPWQRPGVEPDSRWELGLHLHDGGPGTVLLEEGFEVFDTLDEAIMSALLTVLSYYSEPPETWRCVREPRVS